MADQSVAPRFIEEDAGAVVGLPARQDDGAAEKTAPKAQQKGLIATLDAVSGGQCSGAVGDWRDDGVQRHIRLELSEFWQRDIYFLPALAQSCAWAGRACCYCLTIVDYRIWRRFSVWMLLVTIALLVAVWLFGDDTFGARRALINGSFQPGEAAELVIVIYMAAWLTSRRTKIRSITYGLIPFASAGRPYRRAGDAPARFEYRVDHSDYVRHYVFSGRGRYAPVVDRRWVVRQWRSGW